MAHDKIYVPLDGGPADAAALAAANGLAPAYGASVEAVFLGRDDAAVLMVAADGFTGLGVGAVEALRRQREEAEARARAAAQAAGASYSADSGPRAHASAPARLAALAVVEPSAARGEGALADIFQALLMEDGMAVFVPRAPVPPRRIAVAWDGSREAAHALKSAAPLFAGAEETVVLQLQGTVDVKDLGCAAPELAVGWIGAHGGTARAETVSGPDAGRALLQASQGAGADLVVAGAFGHARLREAVFGGVTRAFLDADGPSLLLAH